MRLLTLAAIIAFCSTPVFALAAEVQEQEAAPAADDTVQEPDADDNAPNADMASPDHPIPGDQAPVNATPTPVTPPIASTPATSAPATVVQPSNPKPPGDSGDTNFNTVMLQGLNKVTARAQPIEAPIGSVIRFGTIEIIAHKCWKSSPEDRPENAALLEVSEIKQGEAPQRIFSGWMFSSAPALSSLEHPFYDITVVSCSKDAVK